MGWFSSSSSSSKKEDELAGAPTRQDRQKCWEARDAYFACLDGIGVIKAGEEEGKCSAARKAYEGNCAKSWIDYFNQRRVIAEAQKERLGQATIQTQQQASKR
ncbi:hypothetical protein AMATHDRAFT_143349 [Amanita thiersii Skay4041]|uniref:Cytochrome c oxidase assembly factor 6 n=1 Tax=Amanita thiersii Skay4041 TaxID=703135 RepID=A0A2A9NLZ8_9AGAR|nr:hypothetical protein AMATHDRAFT_143349 [Amanita thiersii Skay4041]